MANLLRLTGELGNFGFWIDGPEIWPSQKPPTPPPNAKQSKFRNNEAVSSKFSRLRPYGQSTQANR